MKSIKIDILDVGIGLETINTFSVLCMLYIR